MKLIATLLFLLWAQLSAASDAFRIGPWSVGNSREDVLRTNKYGPFESVSVTGGLETQNARFLGAKRTVSFVFDAEDKIKYIQVWMYEGSDFKAARSAAVRVFALFDKDFGGSKIPGVTTNGRELLDKGGFLAIVDTVLGRAPALGEKFKREEGVAATTVLDLVPETQPGNSNLVAQLVHESRHNTYYVFLFQDSKNLPDRRVESNVRLEAL